MRGRVPTRSGHGGTQSDCCVGSRPWQGEDRAGNQTGYGPVRRKMGLGAVSKVLPTRLADEPDVGCGGVEGDAQGQRVF